MAIRFITPPDGVETSASPPTETHNFVIVGTDDKNTANAYALGATPSFVISNYGILYRQDISLTRTAFNHWDVSVPYAKENSVTGQWTWDFDTTGGSVHITQAKEEVGRYPTATAPNQQGAIAVDGDEVKGAEIVVPAMKINVSYNHPMGYLTIAQAKFLSNITGLVNSDNFLTFAPGEALFLGARGSDGTEAEATVLYSFAMSSNQTGLSIGSIAGVAKNGWEVAWIRYRDAIVAQGGADNPTRLPKYVYVDRVYDTIPFVAAFGFGG